MSLNIFLQTAPLFRVFLFLMAGILSGKYIFSSISPILLIIIVLFLIAACFFLKKSGTAQSVMLMFAAYLTGMCSYRTAVESADVIKRGYYDYDAVVTSSVKYNGGYSSFDLIMISGNGDCMKIKATTDGHAALHPGDRMHISSKINPPEDRKKGRFSYASYLKRNGYAGSTYISQRFLQKTGTYAGDLSAGMRFKLYLMRLRADLLQQLYDNGLEGRDFATVSAMAFGDKTLLTKEDRDAYSRTGVSHVLALSGLHIGIIYAFLAFILAFMHRVPRFVLIQSAVWIFVVFAGMSPSLMRAALMITIYSAAELMRREKMSLNSLSLAGTASLLISPSMLFDLCFQLSFISVFAIQLFYRPLTEILPSKPLGVGIVMRLSAVSIAAYVGTMPIILYNFGSISFCFILTNLFVVPLTAIILYLTIISFVPLIGSLAGYCLAFAVYLLNAIVWRMASFGHASISDCYISPFTAAMMYVIIFAAYFIYLHLSSGGEQNHIK